MATAPEFWLSGPVEGVPALLQPAAHALMQVRREVHEMMQDFPEQLLWEKPAGMASPGFHLEHIPGVVDRLMTYAKGEMLIESQMKYLQQEGVPSEEKNLRNLLMRIDEKIEEFLSCLKQTDTAMLTEERFVGRKKIPTSLGGLIFHAAEHSMRHTGQLLITTKVLQVNAGTASI